MFQRGGPSFQSQGTGITSPYDTPRTIGGGVIRGNPMGYRTGFQEPELRPKEEVRADIETIFETPKGQWLDDVIGSFGAYSTPYKESGEAKTIGEMGAEQAADITALRKERKEKQDLAKLGGYEGELEDIKTAEAQANEMAILKQKHAYNKAITALEGENLEFRQKIKNESERRDAKIAALDKTDPEYNNKVAAIEAEFDNISKKIIRGTPGMTALIQNAKDRLYKIHSDSVKIGMDSFLQVMVDQWNEKNPDKPKTIVDIIQEQAIADVAGTTIGASKLLQVKAKGGRVGYQMGTTNAGAMPMQASATETIDTPTEDITATETVTEGQQASVQMPYQEFRAAIPAEVSDEIVQLIYYNQDAFADFSQITTQADVYAFNNKYGVSLVLPMDTETT